MSNLLGELDDTVDVEYGQFTVQEVSTMRHALAVGIPVGPWTAVGGPGGLLLHSAANDHYPTVRLELWDGVPPTAPGDWDEVLELACDIDSAVRLQSVTAYFSTHTLPIAHPGSHHARIHVGNRDAATELAEGTFTSAIERWLIQLWHD
ncbi:hypothetical protein [Actinokineospora globicatena]|uniref:Uncharacterized protein n=1 Tax=Actinokineospora globicatena TaxID=103729 RepID=A0A9W6V8X0_9PSEU|nr:hypothetical protein [Actinokineospora globicatena]GLW90363.1 hypothetical protein Aglo03_11790 [Actinokineospora globicatena]